MSGDFWWGEGQQLIRNLKKNAFLFKEKWGQIMEFGVKKKDIRSAPVVGNQHNIDEMTTEFISETASQ